MTHDDPRRDTGEIDRPTFSPWVVRFLGAACVGSVAVDIFQHKHAHFGFQGWIGFDAGYGFAACVAVALAARMLGAALARRDDFYD